MEPSQSQLQVPDGGVRAWLIVFASFCCNGVIFGVVNCYSVIYVQLKAKLEQDGVAVSSSKAGNLFVFTVLQIS